MRRISRAGTSASRGRPSEATRWRSGTRCRDMQRRRTGACCAQALPKPSCAATPTRDVCLAKSGTAARRHYRSQRRSPRPHPSPPRPRSTLLGEAQATAIGDAVVPCEMAILSGAEVLRIDGVLHSMSKVGTWDEPSRLVWYGHEDVVDHWLGFVV